MSHPKMIKLRDLPDGKIEVLQLIGEFPMDKVHEYIEIIRTMAPYDGPIFLRSPEGKWTIDQQ